MSDWILRTARADDADALAHCVDKAYSKYQSRISDLPPVSEGLFDDIKAHIVCVAEIDGAIVGGYVLIEKGDHAILANIAVDPDASGSGIGSGLVRHAEAECRRLGLKDIRLSTHKDMPDNVTWYEHLGWQLTGQSGTKIHMAKTL